MDFKRGFINEIMRWDLVRLRFKWLLILALNTKIYRTIELIATHCMGSGLVSVIRVQSILQFGMQAAQVKSNQTERKRSALTATMSVCCAII